MINRRRRSGPFLFTLSCEVFTLSYEARRSPLQQQVCDIQDTKPQIIDP